MTPTVVATPTTALLWLLLLTAAAGRITAFSVIPTTARRITPFGSWSSSAADDFSAFETSLDDDDDRDNAPAATGNSHESDRVHSSGGSSSSSSWQDNLESLLWPTTPLAQRSAKLRDLLDANRDIRDSVQTALRDGTLDPLLTPTGKRLRDGSRAVARQLTSDILPDLVQPPQRHGNRNNNDNDNNNDNNNNNRPFLPPVPGLPGVTPQDLQTVGGRIVQGLQRRFQTDWQALQDDLRRDPFRSIPQRLTQQSRAVFTGAFAETPSGRAELPYTVVERRADYEIRDYDAYHVASTNIISDVVEESRSTTTAAAAAAAEDGRPGDPKEDTTVSLLQYGAAYNTLAAYVLGANKPGVTLELTTPVITVSTGELRFYIHTNIPEPLEQDETTNVFEAPGRIWIQSVPPARLAVRRFSGFATKGEVARQKQSLLASLSLDADRVELDVPHGSTVPHVVLQYNPPYSVPVLRRNEIAVAVTTPPPPTTANGWSSTATTTNSNNQ
mmetsp:Transcript_14569/g.40373  ORF Transcript_14569/g.40373 Transcript_14569/m.40373 type:complete len:500 (-) Transcript_14569:160-1659(-)|eukprot:CAMPEP_0168736476 /NCGR_PEP_ID=MMETSP0724-20121128/9881_1 /TAXON_ID=265536 /ORGANISM="Amphiprora sp., Strain CCMP467" /LENGTH=499 /DNA_ID=CAMNT_0008783677 /DNA_START=31 /DNA_END=1530 /DNA_ORIENTATION=-